MLEKASSVYVKIEMEMEIDYPRKEIPVKPDSVLDFNSDESDEESIDEDQVISNCTCCGIKCGNLLKVCFSLPSIKKLCCCLKLNKPKGGKKKPKFNLNFLLCLTIVCACSGA
jgi:hypothetical protein